MQPASIRFYNPGAMYPGPSARKFGTTGTQIIGGGHKIAMFDDPVKGAAAQFDLLSRSYSGMPLDRAIAKWSGGNSSPQYAARIAKETGLAPSTVLTPEMLQDPKIAIPIARTMASWEAGRPYPMNDSQWSSAHRMALGGPVPASALPAVPNPNVTGPNGGINVAADQDPPQSQPSPITTGSVPPSHQSAPMAQQQQPQMGLIESLMNPMTLAGLSILADPQRDAARGFAAAGEMSKSMNSRFEQQRAKALEAQKQQQYQGLLEQIGGQAGPMAPALAQLEPDQGVPLLMQLIQRQQNEEQEAEKWATQKKLVEAQTANMQRQAANGGGETPSNIREWEAFQKMNPDQQRQYLTMKRADKYLDTGTEFYQPNPIRPGTSVQTVPKNVAEQQRQEKIGEAAGVATAGLPAAEVAAERLLGAIDRVSKSANLPSVTGTVGGRIPRQLQTEGMAQVQSDIDQIDGATFLQAYNDLRGGGPIALGESQGAKDAYNTLKTQTMGTQAYKEALARYRNEVTKLVSVMRQKAGINRGGYLDKMNAREAVQPQAPAVPPGWKIEREWVQ